jgi:predicted methyltransferase
LKPGGVLAVEQHRSAEGLNVADVASTGYVPESYVIHAARNAGFVLEARSELNANPKDDHDHPFGVWTLPPVRQSAGAQRSEAAHLDARTARRLRRRRRERPHDPAFPQARIVPVLAF